MRATGPGPSAGAVEFFGEPAVFEELLVELSELLVEQVVGLVNQADQGVGGGFRGAFDKTLIGRIGPIGLIGQLTDFPRVHVIFGPEREFVLPEES